MNEVKTGGIMPMPNEVIEQLKQMASCLKRRISIIFTDKDSNINDDKR